MDKARTVRVRIKGERAVLTLQGSSGGAARVTRGEWEYPIPVHDAAGLLDGLCEQLLIGKYRRRIPHAGHGWEVEEFLGANAGLVVAEIEPQSEDEAFERPDWVGEDVTGDARYYNSRLIRAPYSRW